MPAKKKVKGKKKKPAKIIEPEKPLEEKHPSDFDVYKLGKILGKGAFGAVFQGLDTNTGALVAIKTIPLNANQSSLSEVQSEIELMSKLRNEHIVKYIDSKPTEDFLYIVMEYAEGGSLQHLQKKYSNFNEQLASQYIHQVLLGLQYLHSQSIIHRDIKAANILLNNNVAKLSDFGISVDLSKGTKDDADFQCSPYWAAPEVINMESITEKADIWSLGITAIEMCTGQPPYYDLAPIPAMFKIVQNQETPLPENISHEFKDFLLGCLNRNVTFRKSTSELLNHNWITRKNLKQNNQNVQHEVKDKAKQNQANLDIFAESSDDDDMNFDGSLSPKASAILKPNLKVGGGGNLDIIDDDTDDDGDSIKPKEQLAPKDINDFVEDDQDQDDFGEAFNVGSAGNSSFPLQYAMPTAKPTNSNLNDLDAFVDDNSENDDDMGDGPLSIGFQAPRININLLDSVFEGEEDEDPKQKEQERQNNLMKSVIAMMDKLPGLIDTETENDNDIDNDKENDNDNDNDNDDNDNDDDNDDDNLDNNSNSNLKSGISLSPISTSPQILKESNQKTIIDTCAVLLKDFKEEMSLRNNLTGYHGVIPIVEIIQTRNLFLLEHALPFIIIASNDQTDTQNMLCVLGVLPYLFDYCIDKKYNVVQSIQEMSLQLLHNICTTKKKPLQMFISAGGLTKMPKILDSYSFQERPKITKLIIEMVDAVFSFKCSTPKSCFARIMAQSDFIMLLGRRFVDISKDDVLIKKLCGIFEVFSTADYQVKLRMAESEFIDNIFIKAKFKSDVPSSPVSSSKVPLSVKNNQSDALSINLNDDDDDDFFGDSDDDNKKSDNGQQTLEEVTATTSDLNDFDLFTIMRVFNNLAMDNEVVLKDKLWKTNLVERLLEYLRGDRCPQMNPMLSACFSAVFHLSRVLSPENVPKIVPLIPMLAYIINKNQPLKELATTLFLNFIIDHTNNDLMRRGLEESKGIEILFKLLKENPHNELIISSYSIWASFQPKEIEQSLINHIDEFSDIISKIFTGETIKLQTIYSDQLLNICDKCPLLAEKLGQTQIISCIVSKLSSDQLDDYPELRKSFISMILVFYQTAQNPKKLIVQHRIDRVGKKLINDPSKAVKSLAEQLMQSVSSNYVL